MDCKNIIRSLGVLLTVVGIISISVVPSAYSASWGSWGDSMPFGVQSTCSKSGETGIGLSTFDTNIWNFIVCAAPGVHDYGYKVQAQASQHMQWRALWTEGFSVCEVHPEYPELYPWPGNSRCRIYK